MAARILVVDDDAEICALVQRYLEREGYLATTAATGAEALLRIEESVVDLTVLDLGLPDIPGEEVLAEHIARGIPVVVLTARAGTQNTIRGLEIGADDYVTKPFSPRELLLRVRAVLHRAAIVAAEPVASYGGSRLVVDEDRHEVALSGTPVHLTPSEWGVLAALAGHPGHAFSRYELVNRVHGYEFAGYERTIDTHVKNLRHKLGDTAQSPQIIETVPGVGYRLGLTRDG